MPAALLSPRRATALGVGSLAAIACSLIALSARAQVLLPVPYDEQNNKTTTCGSCGSASTGMGLAYVGKKNSADEIEQWLYAGLECGPGEYSLKARADQYCADHQLQSPCTEYFDWGAGDAWGNLIAELNAGRPFVANVHQYYYDHYVLVVGWDNDNAYLNDPIPSHTGPRPRDTFLSQWAEKGYDGLRFLITPAPPEDPVADELTYQAWAFHQGRTSDIDGDGKQDVCGRGLGGISCYLSKTGVFDTLIGGPAWSDSDGWSDPSNYSTIRMGDINGDGLADLCVRSDFQILCYPSTGAGFGAAIGGPDLSDAGGWNSLKYFHTLQLADVDGDGKDDVCARGMYSFDCWKSTGTGFGNSVNLPLPDTEGWDQPQYGGTLRMGDLNGDGKADVCVRGVGGIRCWLSDGVAFGNHFGGPAWSDEQSWGGTHYEYWSTIRLADIDGDGKDDICARAAAGIVCALSTGNGFGPIISGPEFSDASAWNKRQYFSTIRFGDVNGDGRQDLCARGLHGFSCATYNGSAFVGLFSEDDFADENGWDHPMHYRTLTLADYDGDGKADVCGRLAAGWACWRSLGTALAPPTPAIDPYSSAAGWTEPQYYTTLRMQGVKAKPVPAPDSGAGGAAGAAGTTGAGGTAGAVGPEAGDESSGVGGSTSGSAGVSGSQPSGGSAGKPSQNASDSEASGCGCSVPGKQRASLSGLLTLLALLAVRASQSRRRQAQADASAKD